MDPKDLSSDSPIGPQLEEIIQRMVEDLNKSLLQAKETVGSHSQSSAQSGDMQELRRKSNAFIRLLRHCSSRENLENYVVKNREIFMTVEEASDFFYKLPYPSFNTKPSSSDQSIEEIDQQLDRILKLGPEQVSADSQPNNTMSDNSERPGGGQSAPEDGH